MTYYSNYFNRMF